jgi:NADH-quinone oxidoreductase subunit L
VEHRAVVVTFGNWFAVHDYRFPLVLMADRLSLPFLAMTVLLSGLIGQFSATYLHRERGFFRFFVLLHLFAFGSLLAFAAGSFDLLAGGWEIVGITSVLLIAFFQLRPAPVENASPRLRRVSRLRHWIAGGRFRHAQLGGNGIVQPRRSDAQGWARRNRLSSSAAGGVRKSRAGSLLRMAPARHGGPHASSAIFYGAISIHAGAYLLLRVQPMLAQSTLASALVI